MNTLLILSYLVGSITFVIGLKMLSHPDSARKGNLVAAFGMLVAIIGTMFLTELSEEAMVQILTEPKNALIKQYQSLLEMEGVKLEATPAALTAIAKKALLRKTGARGLRSILEHVLLETMYELPNLKNIDKVVIEKENIDIDTSPKLIKKSDSKVA